MSTCLITRDGLKLNDPNAARREKRSNDVCRRGKAQWSIPLPNKQKGAEQNLFDTKQRKHADDNERREFTHRRWGWMKVNVNVCIQLLQSSVDICSSLALVLLCDELLVKTLSWWIIYCECTVSPFFWLCLHRNPDELLEDGFCMAGRLQIQMRQQRGQMEAEEVFQIIFWWKGVRNCLLTAGFNSGNPLKMLCLSKNFRYFSLILFYFWKILHFLLNIWGLLGPKGSTKETAGTPQWT